MDNNIPYSNQDKAEKAQRTFTWALDTEKKHLQFYTKALEALKANAENTLSPGYAVCPVCGNTYESTAVDESCAFCGAPKENFIIF